MANERNVDPGYGGRDGAHEVWLQNREYLRVAGVLHVDSFDDREIVLATDMGTLTVEGEDLQIKQLDLEAGAFAVTGLFTALSYTSSGPGDLRGKSRGLLDRLLR